MTLMLAQTAEVAEHGLSLLERVQAGGVPLISLIMLTLALFALYKVARENADLREAATAKAEEGTKKAEDRASERAESEAALYREMMERDREAHETQVALKNAFEGFAATLKEQATTCETSNRLVRETQGTMRELASRIEDLERTFRRNHDG